MDRRLGLLDRPIHLWPHSQHRAVAQMAGVTADRVRHVGPLWLVQHPTTASGEFPEASYHDGSGDPRSIELFIKSRGRWRQPTPWEIVASTPLQQDAPSVWTSVCFGHSQRFSDPDPSARIDVYQCVSDCPSVGWKPPHEIPIIFDDPNYADIVKTRFTQILSQCSMHVLRSIHQVHFHASLHSAGEQVGGTALVSGQYLGTHRASVEIDVYASPLRDDPFESFAHELGHILGDWSTRIHDLFMIAAYMDGNDIDSSYALGQREEQLAESAMLYFRDPENFTRRHFYRALMLKHLLAVGVWL